MIRIALLVVTPLLLVAAMAVRFARERPVLNSVDYSRIPDPASLHRWVGHRLLVLPVVTLATGLMALSSVQGAIIGSAIAVVSVIAVVIGVGVGCTPFEVSP